MSALICQRPSSIDRRDKRLGNGQARSRRHRIKRAVRPIRPRSFGVHANYLDVLNASRVRIHRQKPKALGLKFSCGFTRHLFHQGSPASGYRPLGGGARVFMRVFCENASRLQCLAVAACGACFRMGRRIALCRAAFRLPQCLRARQVARRCGRARHHVTRGAELADLVK